jgi:hypothetical protein
VTAKLDKPLKRELIIAGQPYVLTLSTQGIKLVPKGKRKGYELDWGVVREQGCGARRGSECNARQGSGPAGRRANRYSRTT